MEEQTGLQTCPICASDTRMLFHPVDRRVFYRCSGCGFSWLDAVHHLGPEEECARYRLHRNTEGDAGYVAYLRGFIERALRPYLPAGRLTALDFGCGPVPVLARLLERDLGCRTAVYDPCFFPDTPDAGTRFDLVIATEVAEHLSDPVATFRELSGLLRPEGLLGIMTLFSPECDSDFLDWFYLRDRTHRAFFPASRSACWPAGPVCVWSGMTGYGWLRFAKPEPLR